MRQRQSGQKKQKSKDLGTDSSSQDWKAAPQSWSMYLGRWRLGQEEVRERTLECGIDHENTLNATLKDLDFGGQMFIS